jgi:hypothetical protein
VDLDRSKALHARAQAFVRGAAEDFEAFACELARYQAEEIPNYMRLCRARGVDPAKLVRADDIPGVPTDAFKLARVAAFDASADRVVFRTSGTTVGTRGMHVMRDPTTYEAAAVAFGKEWLTRDFERPVPVVVLGPKLGESSLAHMCAAFVGAFGEPASREDTWLVDDGVIDLSRFDERVARALTRDQPMLVLATSIALWHFREAVGDDTFVLPAGSRVMHTGGFKGVRTEVEPAHLRKEIARIFAIDERAIVAEYGMTELSSQFYERTLFDPGSRHGVYAEPPWARVVPVDPETLVRVPDGEIGIAKVIDLMNIDSAVAVVTQDRVRRVGGGFELLGRLPGAAPRGCSIAIDELLAKSG